MHTLKLMGTTNFSHECRLSSLLSSINYELQTSSVFWIALHDEPKQKEDPSSEGGGVGKWNG